MKQLVEQHAEGNIAAFARELGVAAPFLNEFLNGKRGAGSKLLNAIADFTGQSLDQLYGRKDSLSLDRLGSHPNWIRSAEAAKRLNIVPDEAIDVAAQIANLSTPRGSEITPAFVIDLAQFVARYGLHNKVTKNSD
ncbi:MAG: helix-turn-helix transcriptional regulator [Deltaproteobacteria bacterium]|nr:helix-turn-helix transcriptional regulator [Deltaproteobacteria bacterium]